MTETLHIPTMYRDCTLKALNKTGSAKAAAEKMGVSRRTVDRYRRQFDIEWDEKRRQYVSKQTENQTI